MPEVNIDPSCSEADLKCYTQLGQEGKIGKREVKMHVLYLNEIPTVCENIGMPVGAKMLRQWFSNPAWQMPQKERPRGVDDSFLAMMKAHPERVNDTIITMDWLLHGKSHNSHHIVKNAMDKLSKTEVWASKDGIERLKSLLTKANWKPEMASFKFGDKAAKAIEQDQKYQVNRLPFGSYFEEMDDFYAAILFATLKIAVIGEANYNPKKRKDIFTATELGFYIRDTFDFNSAWYEDATFGVGVWSRKGVLNKKQTVAYMGLLETAKAAAKTTRAGSVFTLAGATIYTQATAELSKKFSGYVRVLNEDFNRWSRKHGTGGDFYVFSDVLWVPLEEPVEIAL